jgi:hypothetical protein
MSMKDKVEGIGALVFLVALCLYVVYLLNTGQIP